jgi:hypothetical protein
MRRLPRRVLYLFPVLLVLTAAGVWAWQEFGNKAEPPPRAPELRAKPEVRVRTDTLAGVRFEVEYQVGETIDFSSFDDEAIRYHRGSDNFEYDARRLVIQRIEFPSPRLGDVVRWNRDGSILFNGVKQQSLPQPRSLEKPGTDLRWDHRGWPSEVDTLRLS